MKIEKENYNKYFNSIVLLLILWLMMLTIISSMFHFYCIGLSVLKSSMFSLQINTKVKLTLVLP